MFKGAKFYSSQEFQQKLKEFEEEHKCSFVFKNSTRAKTDNRSRKRPIDEKKFELARGTLVCAHYGTKRLTASKGIKTSAPSQKLQCEAMFSFKYDEWEQCLLIHKCNLEHNHVLDSRLFSQQHKQKKFSVQEKAVLKEVVALNPDNEKLLMMVQKDFQKSLTLHEVRTLKHKLRSDNKDGNIEGITKQLQEVEDLGGSYQLLLSNNGADSPHLIDMIAFSTKQMISCFRSFPECIFIDGTYKKNNSGYPLYQIMVQDCLGKSRPVFYAFVRCETTSILTSLLQTFAEFIGDDIAHTQVIMSDKCASEASAIKTVMPWARHLLCHWHVYAAMEKRLKALKLESSLKSKLTHLHMSLKDTTDAQEFQSLEEKLRVACLDFYTYYCQNWQNCKVQWAAHQRLDVRNFLNDTNNFVESENSKLGKLLTSSRNIASALYHLHNHGIVRVNELSQQILKESITHRTYLGCVKDFTWLYAKFFSHPVKSMIANHVGVEQILVAQPDDTTFIATEPSGFRFKVKVDAAGVAACHCPFCVQMALPCLHIMACHLHGMDAALHSANNRWLRSRHFTDVCNHIPVATTSVQECIPAEQRHYESEALLLMLSNVLKSSGGSQYKRRLATLKDVLNFWESGRDVSVSGVHAVEEGMSREMGAVEEGVSGEVGAVVVGVSREVGAVEDGVSGEVGAVEEGVSGEVGAVEEGVSREVGAVEDSESGEVGAVEEGVSGEEGAVEEGVSREVGAVEEGVSGEVGAVEEGVSGEVGAVEEGVSREVGAVEEGVSREVGAVEEGVNGEVGAVEEGVSGEVGAVEEGVSGEVSAVEVSVSRGVGVTRGCKRRPEISLNLSEVSGIDIAVPFINARGRPSKKTKRKNGGYKKGKVARVLRINENICHICLEEEVCKEKANSSGYDDWTRCSQCVRWYHTVCITEHSDVDLREFVCKHH